MRLKTYVLLILLGLIGWQTVLFVGTFYYVEYEAAVKKAKEHQDDTMEKLRTVCQESAMRTSPFAAINFVNILGKDRAIALAVCADFNGRILAHTDADLIGQYLPKDSPALTAMADGTVLHKGDGEVLERYGPVMVQGRRAGAVSAGFNARVMEEEVSEALWGVLERILLVTFVTLAVVFLTALAVARRITDPITELARGAKEIAAGNLDYKVPVERERSDELKFLIEEFNKMSAKLKEIDEIKERFLASITHDLRVPLVGIQGHTELLMNDPDLTEEQGRHLETIYNSSQILSHFISDILDLNRLEAGAMDLKRAPTSLAELVSAVCDLCSVKAEEFGVRLEATLPPDLPTVQADRKLIHRVLANLVSNALKFTPEGGVVAVRAFTVLDVDPATGDAAPRGVRVEVSDNGPGVPAGKLESVFEKFFQVEETRSKARSEGTGLGLAIAREIVEAHGGRIWAESPPGSGATFKFTLPLAALQPPADIAER